MGRILRVDLSEGKTWAQVIDESSLKRFIGGQGLGAYMLYKEVGPTVDPLSPENRLMFLTGPLTGVIDSRSEAVFKSPLSGGFGYSNCGGTFGSELRFAGFDAIVLQGRAKKPTFLYVEDGSASLKEAQHLWGHDTYDVEILVRKELDDLKIKVASIGIAGENLVRFSSIMTDKGRAFARAGCGAVMGSKLLKAVAVRGRLQVPIHDKNGLISLWRENVGAIVKSPFCATISKFGTAGLFAARVPVGYGIVRNWSLDISEFSGVERLSGENIISSYPTSKYYCYKCPVGCGHLMKRPESGDETHIPEYETLAALGSQCCNDDLESVLKANDLCNRHGLDTISTGTAIAFAMECFEKGILSAEDVGFEINWGNSEAVVELVERIAKREGFGDVLAEGVRRAAARIGRNATELAMEVKGLEVAMHDPRSMFGWGLGYATAACGGRHNESFVLSTPMPEIGLPKRIERNSVEGQADAVLRSQNLISFVGSAGLCYFVHVTSGHICQIPGLVSCVTGWTMSWDQIMETGERIFNLKRAFNMRHNISPKEDTLPERLMNEPLPAGASKGIVVPLKRMLDEYYELRGWDAATGRPSRKKLLELGLEEIAESLWSDRMK